MSWMTFLKNTSLNFSNLPKYQPSLFHFGLVSPLWCFSALENYYLEVRFDLKMTLSNARSELFHLLPTMICCFTTYSIVFWSKENRTKEIDWTIGANTRTENGSLYCSVELTSQQNCYWQLRPKPHSRSQGRKNVTKKLRGKVLLSKNTLLNSLNTHF